MASGSNFVAARSMAARLSVPARVLRANWKGRVASSNTWAKARTSVRETSLRKTSPVAMPRTPPAGLRNAMAVRAHPACRSRDAFKPCARPAMGGNSPRAHCCGPRPTLTEALIVAFSHRAEPLPAAALAEAPVFPPSTLVHLGWVVRHLAHVDGYISAAGQETCLTVYGWQQLAAGLDRLSDEFRIEAPSAAVAQPTCRRLTIMYGDVSAAEAHPLPENIPEHEDGAGRQVSVAQDRAEPAPSAPPPVERAGSDAEPLEAGAADEAPAIGSPSPAWPHFGLAWLTTIDLSAEFRERLPTLRCGRAEVPYPLLGGPASCTPPRDGLEIVPARPAFAPGPLP